jgi:hypothetical protein
LVEIGERAFRECQHLECITIPSSVRVLGRGAFLECGSLRSVQFLSDSQLTEIGCRAFWECDMLESMAIPLSVETIGESCFSHCSSLASVTLLPDSKLVRIEASALANCSALSSFVVPSSVVFVGESSFAGCCSLSRLQFACPSRVRELLTLPLSRDGLPEIPDSVEILSFVDELEWNCRYVLEFGSESKLKQIHRVHYWRPRRRCFVRLKSRTLKVFRSELEIEGNR